MKKYSSVCSVNTIVVKIHFLNMRFPLHFLLYPNKSMTAQFYTWQQKTNSPSPKLKQVTILAKEEFQQIQRKLTWSIKVWGAHSHQKFFSEFSPLVSQNPRCGSSMNTHVCLHAKFFLRQHITSNKEELLYIGSHHFPHRKLQDINTVLQKSILPSVILHFWD